MGRVRSVGWCAIAIASLVACKAAPESAPASSPPQEPSSTSAPVAVVEPEPSPLPPDVPPGAPATLGVNDMAGHPARWNRETVVLFARLRYQIMGCGKSVPRRCFYSWQLIDADVASSMIVDLDHTGLDVPVVCHAASAPLVAESPCGSDELDEAQRYRLEGQLVVEDRQLRFVATRIEAAEAPQEEPEPPREDGRNLVGPTQAEFDAWDRNDPERQHIYQWDVLNFGRMQGYLHDLECFRARMLAAGNAGRGAAPGSPRANAWAKSKRELVVELDVWQKQIFANEPRILEHSKFVSYFLEAHELISRELPSAYDADDQVAIDTAQAHWMIVIAKTDKYTRALGEGVARATVAHCKAMRPR